MSKYKRNPEVATQPLFFGKIEGDAYEKALCIIYPNFSIYEVVGLTSTFSSIFGIEIDYVGSDRNVIRSEDGLACQPTRTLDKVVIEDYSCVILPGMINIASALVTMKN